MRSRAVSAEDASLKCVDEFCYFGNMIRAGGVPDISSVTRVRNGWKKFR